MSESQADGPGAGRDQAELGAGRDQAELRAEKTGKRAVWAECPEQPGTEEG